MYAKLLGFLLFACQIILNGSIEIHPVTDHISVISVSPTPAPTVDANGYSRFPDVNAAYKVYEVEKTWIQARDQCISEGAYLAVTDSVGKIRHVKSLRVNDVIIGVHVGIHLSNGQWSRADNDLPLSSLPWAEYNPDGSGDCVSISPIGDELGDDRCQAVGYYVCEKAI